MNREADSGEVRKLRIEWFHKIFFWLDAGLSLASLVLSIVFVGRLCVMTFMGYYSIFYLGQTIQHYLCFKMPKMDIVKYDKVIKRYVGVVSAIEITYFLMSFMYWTKWDLHPFYCFVIQTLHLPLALGIFFILHFIASLLLYIQFLHGYISRKYYLLALGGFQVELRLIRQREDNLQQIALLEPFYNEYPPYSHSNKQKFYEFEDIAEDVEGQEVCSICLTREKQGFHPIYTSCKHYFHRECIEDWAKINSRCPECRTDFKEVGLVCTKEEEQNKE